MTVEAKKERLAAATRKWKLKHPGVAAANKKSWYAANPDKARATAKAWRRANHAKARATEKAWYSANRKKVLAAARALNAEDPGKMRRKRLRNTYGLSSGIFEKMLVAQSGECAICKKSFSGTPFVDHSHVTGKVRALLCPKCNAGIGMFSDDPDILWAALKYVVRHREST